MVNRREIKCPRFDRPIPGIGQCHNPNETVYFTWTDSINRLSVAVKKSDTHLDGCDEIQCRKTTLAEPNFSTQYSQRERVFDFWTVHDGLVRAQSWLVVQAQAATLYGWVHDDVIKRKHFRVTGPLCGEFTGPGEFPTQRPVTRSFDVFYYLPLNTRLCKPPWGWRFETISWLLWRQCNVVPWIAVDTNLVYTRCLCYHCIPYLMDIST